MSTPFYEPMLACALLDSDTEHNDTAVFDAMSRCVFPVGATLKLDGVLGLRLDRTLKSRTRKLIPNELVRNRSVIMPGGTQCEIYTPLLDFNTISGVVRTKINPTPEAAEKLEFHVLDNFANMDWLYCQRLDYINTFMRDMPPHIKFQYPVNCDSPEELFKLWQKYDSENGEGICWRPWTSRYKQGRPTWNEQLLFKYARFVYEEGEVVGFEEQLENTNPDNYNAVGKMHRSKEQSGMIPKNTLGAIWIRQEGKPDFKVSSGFSSAQAKEIWLNQSKYLGKLLRYKHKPHGRLNKPRSPVFDGWREKGF